MVGAHLLLHLVEKEEPIRAIYRNLASVEKTKSLFQLFQKADLFTKIEWVEADITDIPSLETAYQNVNYVYHCAALISYDPNDEESLRKINIEGTANIVNFCIDYKIKKLCYVSSIAALGDLTPTEVTLTETTEWNPEISHSDYAISKYGAEIEVWRGQQEGLDVVIVNPGVIFGAGFWNQGSGLFFSSIQKGFPFYTMGSTGFVSVADVVKIMMQLMNSDLTGERYTLIAENITYKDLFFLLADALNTKRPFFEAKRWHLSLMWRLDWLFSFFFRTRRKLSKDGANSLLRSRKISNQKIKNALNFEFQSIETVIKEIIALQKK